MDFLPAERLGQAGVEHVPADDGTKLAVRVSGEQGTRAPVVMLHGLQSHAGWFLQSQAFLAHLGAPTYAMDRRGSGLSEGKRGECTDFHEMMRDVRAVVSHARARHGVEKVHVLGHCFGALPASLLATAHPEMVHSLILASSGLHTKVSIKLGRTPQVLWSKASRTTVYIPVHIDPEMFSEIEECQDFIREDEQRLRYATGSFYFEVLQARRYVRAHRDHLTMPLFMANAGDDPVCDNAANESFFWSLPTEHKLLVRYPRSRHVIEFSHQRDDFFRDLAWWLDRFGGEGHAQSPAP